MNDKEQRIMKDIDHKISSQIIKTAVKHKVNIIKLERLQNIRSTTRTSRKNNPSLHTWSFPIDWLNLSNTKPNSQASQGCVCRSRHVQVKSVLFVVISIMQTIDNIVVIVDFTFIEIYSVL